MEEEYKKQQLTAVLQTDTAAEQTVLQQQISQDISQQNSIADDPANGDVKKVGNGDGPTKGERDTKSETSDEPAGGELESTSGDPEPEPACDPETDTTNKPTLTASDSNHVQPSPPDVDPTHTDQTSQEAEETNIVETTKM